MKARRVVQPWMEFHGTNNTPGHDRIAPALLGWVLGTAAHLRLVHVPGPGLCLFMLGVAALAAVVAVAASKSRFPWMAVIAVMISASALAFSVCGLRAIHFSGSALAQALEGQDLQIEGRVAAMPQRQDDATRFRFEVAEASLDGRPLRLPPLIDLGWYAGEEAAQAVPQLRAGDRWRLVVRLKAPHGGSNPFGFDYELALWEQGVQAAGYVRSGTQIATGWGHPVERARQAVRDAVLETVADRPSAGVVAALVTGDQNAIDRAGWDVFRATGVAHLMSISGLHITLFAWVAALLARALWRRSARLCRLYPAQLAGLVAGVALAAGYALFSGWGVPAQRTVWMLAAVSVLRLAGRRWPWPHVWLLACAAVVAVDPWALLQAGFWLSFVAVGVLFATDDSRAGRDSSPTEDGWRARAAKAARAMLREQLIVTAALAPLALLLFQQMSVVGLAANLVAIPWVTLVVTPLAMAGVVWAPLWHAAAAAVQMLGWGLGVMAAWPFASVSLPAPPAWAGAAAVAGGILLALRLPPALRLMGVPLVLPALLWQPQRPPEGAFDLLAADIGQGNAVLVRTAGHALLYDAGPRFSRDSDAGHRVLVPLLRALGERLDTVVVSHRDIDHSGGARAVLAMQPQAALLSSIEPGHDLQQIRPATRCEAGQRWAWDGVAFEILHPEVVDYGVSPRPNAISCVLRITAGAQVALLAGDIEKPQEAALLARAAIHPVTLLLVPHHGSKTSSSDVFLDAAAPQIAWVQAGYRNRFGHPAPPVMGRYTAHGVRVFDTVHCGAMRWSSTLPAEVRCQRVDGRRYWNHQPA